MQALLDSCGVLPIAQLGTRSRTKPECSQPVEDACSTYHYQYQQLQVWHHLYNISFCLQPWYQLPYFTIIIIMDIQFIEQEESLETLCFHFILNQTAKSRTLIINSILMQLTCNSQYTVASLFDLCARIVDDACSDSQTTISRKDYYQNMAVLLKEIILKYSGIVPKATLKELEKILAFCCKEVFSAATANEYISVIALILYRIQQPSVLTGTLGIVQAMLMDPKMQICSYRQTTRHQLFSILYKVLQNKGQNELSSEYMLKIVRLIEDEKDPRNISLAFQVYLHLLDHGRHEQLLPIKKKIFDCLEMYYPIDFEGDAGKHSIKLHDISCLLDQCLTNVLFADELRALLMIKMGAAPIGKYISTFISSRHHPVTADAISFWLSLLLRTGQEEYLQEEYAEDSEYTLSCLVTELLNRLMPKAKPIASQTYWCLLQWLDLLVTKKVLNQEENSKFATLIIVTLKDIMSRCNDDIKFLVATYVVDSFVRFWKEGAGEIVYKLGILVPVLQSQYQRLDTEQIGLFILTLSQIFHTSDEPQPKLIVLKLFMTLSKSSAFFKMIGKTNILNSCLELTRNPSSDIKIAKAFVDFMVELYAVDQRVKEAIVGCPKMEVKVYGLLTLASRMPGLYQIITEIAGSEDGQQILKEVLHNLRMFKAEAALQIIFNLRLWLTRQSNEVTKIVDEKSARLGIATGSDLLEYAGRYLGGSMIYLSRNVWRPFLVEPLVKQKLKGMIEEWQSHQPENIFCSMAVAFYNKSLEAFGDQQSAICIENIPNGEAYRGQLHRMLPTEQGHLYTKQECVSWPTLVHYCWSTSDSLRTDLIECLPASILGQQAHRILPIVIKDQHIHTLSKILSCLPESIIVSDIIPFVLTFLQSSGTNTEVESIVACNKILMSLQERAKEDQFVHDSLMKNKGRILVAIEERLLQHRKRRARQSSRTIFSVYNGIK